MSDSVSEQPVAFGPGASLIGVVARSSSRTPADLPAIIILNTGIIHRVGHHRMFVAMSRALAAAGYPVLRFDFSGLGDSDPRDDALSPAQAHQADTRDAVDWLDTNLKARRVILIGLCSGADNAILYGGADPRVVGLVLIDPWVPPTARYYLHNLGRRLLRVRSWIMVLSGRSKAMRQLLRNAASGRRSERDTPDNPLSLSGFERSYQALVRNRVKMLAILTGDSMRQTYREQLIEAFPNVPFGDFLTLTHLPDTDHTFTLEANRIRLLEMIRSWLGAIDAGEPQA